MNKLLNKTGKYYIAAFALIFAATFFISPLGDDFIYVVAPNLHFKLSDLLPNEAFWRPFDVLIGALNGVFPFLFPYINFALVSFSHVMSAYLIEKILSAKGIEKKYAFFGAMFFMFSSICVAVTASPDALNQAFSLLFGLIGLYSYIKNGSYAYIIFSVISLFWKESGISWFFVIPLFQTTETFGTFRGIFKDKKNLSDFILKIIVGIIASALYFAARFALLGKAQLGGDGRYNLSLFSFSTIKNLVMLAASAATGADTVSIFSTDKNMVILILSSVLSAVFCLFMLIKAISVLRSKSESFYTFAVLAACGVLLCIPQAALTSTSEMHAYPAVFVIACVYAYIFNNSPKQSSKQTIALMLCIFTAFAGASFHKYQALYKSGVETKALADSICSYYTDSSKSVLIVYQKFPADYSIYSQAPLFDLWIGQGLKSRFGWEELPLRHKRVMDENEAHKYAKEHSEEYDYIIYVPSESTDAKLIQAPSE